MIPAQANGYTRALDGLALIAVLTLVFYQFGISGFDGDIFRMEVCIALLGLLIARVLWIKLTVTDRDPNFKFLFRRMDQLTPVRFLRTFTVLGTTLVSLVAAGGSRR